MTAPSLSPDATRCPDCSAPLAGTGTCPTCGLRLTGPEAARLWEVDLELLGLERTRGALLAERGRLLGALRPAGTSARAWTAPTAAPRQEWTPQRVQNLLLTLGGLLLAGAALVFAVVTYERLGVGGRAAVLVALTLAAAAAAPRLRARGLASTAEAVGALALALGALDAHGLRTLGLAADSDPANYAAGSAAVLALLAAAATRTLPLRVVRAAAVVLSQLPVPLLLVGTEPSAATAGLVLAGLAAADLAVLALAGRLPAEVRIPLTASTAVVLLVALLTAWTSAYGEEATAGAAALVACAAVLALAAACAADPLRLLLSGSVVPVLGAAGAALVVDDLAATALVLAGVAVIAALAATQLPAAVRLGPLGGALLVAATGVALVAEPVVSGVLRPLTWVDAAWTLPVGSSAREALAPGRLWDGPAVTPLVLLLAAGVALAVAWALHARSVPALVLGAPATQVEGAGPVRRVHLDGPLAAAAAAGALLLAAAVVLPLALDLPFAAALTLLVVLGGALAGAGTAILGRREAPALVAAGTALALHAAVWSLAAQTPTLVALPAVALLCAALAATRVPLPSALMLLAGLLGAAELAAAGAVADLSVDQVGALLVPAVALLAGTAPLLDRLRRPGAEGAAVVTAVVALACASSDVGWTSWTLAGLGLVALATALRSDRRSVAVAGALLLSASSWVRLADAGVTAPEPYALPVAALALGLGHLRRRSDPATTSWAYAPGLSLALVPSLLRSVADETLTRSLLVGLAALAVVLLGARLRLRAPLVVGAAVLAVVAVDLLGPYAAALPRWLSLGAAGTLLLVVGATYEQRRRDLDGLRERYDALA